MRIAGREYTGSSDDPALNGGVARYVEKVAGANRGGLLEQRTVDRPGHRALTGGELVGAFTALVQRAAARGALAPRP